MHINACHGKFDRENDKECRKIVAQMVKVNIGVLYAVINMDITEKLSEYQLRQVRQVMRQDRRHVAHDKIAKRIQQ